MLYLGDIRYRFCRCNLGVLCSPFSKLFAAVEPPDFKLAPEVETALGAGLLLCNPEALGISLARPNLGRLSMC